MNIKNSIFEQGSIAGEIVQNNSLITVSNATIATSTIVYKVQLIASAKNIPLLAKNFKGLSTITSRFDNEVLIHVWRNNEFRSGK